MIGVIQPTRGLIFSEAQSSLERNLMGYSYKVHRSFNLPIPDCQNTLVEEALEENYEFLLFHEEDVVLPEGAVDDMVMACEEEDIVCMDYAVQGYSCITRDRNTDEILWCGLGATLVRPKVFRKLEKPYFRADKLLLLNDWPNVTWIDAGAQGYGAQDIYFFMKAREAGLKIKQVHGECRHLKLEELGRAEINRGVHKIVDKEKISKRQIL